MTPRVSIAMCAYNGARHIREQIESFVAQTRQPDELVVCDDGSSDDTASIVQELAATTSFPIRFYRNETNLGFARNFEKAASLCEGDIIFFSDQDDVWRADKIALMTARFAENIETGLVFCDADLVNDDLSTRHQRYWEKQGFSPAAQDRLESDAGACLLLKDPAQMAAGATMAYAARFATSIFPLPEGWTHDAWIATVVAAQSRVALVREPLNLYRQHQAQVYGASSTPTTRRQYARQRSGSSEHFHQTALRYRALLDRIAGVRTQHPGFSAHVRGKIAHWEGRGRMRRRWRAMRVPVVAWEFLRGRYARYSQGIRSAGMDLLY